MKQPQVHDIATPEICGLVDAYIVARAAAEAVRTQVDAIRATILTEIELYADLSDGRRIMAPRDYWLSEDKPALARYYAACDERERSAGLKPVWMPVDICPALMREEQQTIAENNLIAATGAPFGIDNDKLLQSRDGLNNRQKWIDLVVGLILAWRSEHA